MLGSVVLFVVAVVLSIAMENRRPISPLNAGRQFGGALLAPPSLSTAVDSQYLSSDRCARFSSPESAELAAKPRDFARNSAHSSPAKAPDGLPHGSGANRKRDGLRTVMILRDFDSEYRL